MSKQIEELRPNYPNLNILHFAQSSKMGSIDKIISKKLGLTVGIPSGTTTFNVLSDGHYCCGGYAPYIDPNLILGNVKDDDLFEIWQTNKLLEKIRRDGTKLVLLCSRCPKYISNECQGSKYETELNRLVHPEVTNPTCIKGAGPSLLSIENQQE